MKENRFLLKRQLTPVQIVVLSFISVILFGAILLTFPISSKTGEYTNFLTALFTATSATCVTGLVVVDTGTYWSLFGQIVILILIQIGGLGYMTIATFFLLFSHRKISLKQRFVLKEGLNVYKLSGILSFTKMVFFYVILLEFSGAVILTLRFIREASFPVALWKGLFHSVSAFCNAGFDIIGNFRSFTPYANDLTVNLVVMSLIVFGGIGFYVAYELYYTVVYWFKERILRKFSLHSKIALKFTIFLIIFGAITFFILEYTNLLTLGVLPFRGKILASLFQSITPRTAGFNTVNISMLKQPTQLLLIILMFIGGSPGGTAGGVKTTTFFVFLVLIMYAFRERTNVVAMGRTIKLETLRKAIFIISFALFIILFSSFLILTAQGNEFNFMQVLFEVVSAFGTVGLSTGITTKLSSFSRVVIIATMFIGRVGPLSFILSLATRRIKKVPEYPEEEVAVG